MEDATAQAEMVRRGEASPVELVEAAIARIEKINPEINAVITPMFDEAIAAAKAPVPNGPFRGVPILFKDMAAHQAGMPIYQGNRILKEIDFRVKADSPLGGRFREAGFITLGKTNTPEFGAQPTTQPLAFGPTRNPWDLTRSTAGSSGGSAAAVASGMVAIAHASDGGGSIRMPAAWCGLVGLKPSRGRTSRGALSGRLSVEHVVAHSVRDVAGVLDAVAGSEPGDLYLAPAPRRPYLDELDSDPGRLRIGVLTRVDATGVDTDPECERVAREAAKLLESLGHIVEDSHPERLYDDEFHEKAETEYGANMRATVAGLWQAIERKPEEPDFEPYTWARMERARDTTGEQLVRAVSWLQRYTSRIVGWWAGGFDLLVTPTTSEPPAILESLVPPEADPWSIDSPRFARIRCFVRPFNVTGQPAISLPLGQTPEGLPLGVQLVAAPGREDLLLQTAAQVEPAFL